MVFKPQDRKIQRYVPSTLPGLRIAKTLNTFVANRVAEIQRLTDRVATCWNIRKPCRFDLWRSVSDGVSAALKLAEWPEVAHQGGESMAGLDSNSPKRHPRAEGSDVFSHDVHRHNNN